MNSIKHGTRVYDADEIDVLVNGQRIRPLTDSEAQAMGLAADDAAKLHIDELVALLGSALVRFIGERESKLPKHIQMIAARVALEQGLDPRQCLNDLDATLERMGADEAFGAQVEALGKRMGAPKLGHVTYLQGTRQVPPNRHARRTAKAQARGRESAK